MMTLSEVRAYQDCFAQMLNDAGIVITDAERDRIEIADFGLDDFERQGLGLILYENNDRYCAKELMMLPGQACPQHRHPPIEEPPGRVIDPGKRETFRCRYGRVLLYVDSPMASTRQAAPPERAAIHYTAAHEIELEPGRQHTIEPGIWHWFKAGDRGAIISEFSTTSRDDADIFADPRVQRMPL